MSQNGHVSIEKQNGIAKITFFHPKKNSLPGNLLSELASGVTELGNDDAVSVVILQSEGDGPFCAGASFDELLAIENPAQGKAFFMGFARLILAMKDCPKFVIVRVQGKAVGGGVGVASAGDYTLATDNASVKLSELALGIGPFVVGPAVKRKIGTGPYNALSIDTNWRDAAWAKNHGLFAEIYPNIAELDMAIDSLTGKLAKSSPEAMKKLKAAFWDGTGHWNALLEARAEMSGNLILSDFSSNAIAAFKKGR